MKSLFKGVLISLIGMISLSGYSSTTTSTLKKKDAIEKFTFATIFTDVVIVESTSLATVENRDIDIGQSQKYNTYKRKQNTARNGITPEKQTPETAVNPPPLLLRE